MRNAPSVKKLIFFSRLFAVILIVGKNDFTSQIPWKGGGRGNEKEKKRKVRGSCRTLKRMRGIRTQLDSFGPPLPTARLVPILARVCLPAGATTSPLGSRITMKEGVWAASSSDRSVSFLSSEVFPIALV